MQREEREGVNRLKEMDANDWFSAILGSVIAGIGGAMAWFRGEKKLINEKLLILKDEMGLYDRAQAEQTTRIAVLESSHRNTEARLDAIAETTNDTNRKVDGLHDTLTDVLLTLKRR